MDSDVKIPVKAIIKAGPMLNAYPDSIGGTLGDIVKFLQTPELKDVFQSFYVLPSIFNTDLDRGFSVIDYELNELYASQEDMKDLNEIGITLKFDFVLNHSSVLSRQFQDILKNGENSIYKDFFINWNKFWEGCGQMTDEGYIQPDHEYIKEMFFRKPGLPLLNVRMPDGKEVPYWNTFYQEVKYGKIDTQDLMMVMDIKYAFVWAFYKDTLKKLARYGAEIIRLDAFAYVSKEPGAKNFLNDPGTWELLGRIKVLADKYGLALLPEIHSKYEEKIHEKLAEEGYMTYDFFLPGLF